MKHIFKLLALLIISQKALASTNSLNGIVNRAYNTIPGSMSQRNEQLTQDLERISAMYQEALKNPTQYLYPGSSPNPVYEVLMKLNNYTPNLEQIERLENEIWNIQAVVNEVAQTLGTDQARLFLDQEAYARAQMLNKLSQLEQAYADRVIENLENLEFIERLD